MLDHLRRLTRPNLYRTVARMNENEKVKLLIDLVQMCEIQQRQLTDLYARLTHLENGTQP